MPARTRRLCVGSTVHLQGAGTDPHNLPLNYVWSLPTVPHGSVASLSATNVQNPTFAADLPGTYSAQLIVSNGTLFSPPSSVTITSTRHSAGGGSHDEYAKRRRGISGATQWSLIVRP